MKSKIFIIAEAGVNHNGSLAVAKKLIDKAKEVLTDAEKFQPFKISHKSEKNRMENRI